VALFFLGYNKNQVNRKNSMCIYVDNFLEVLNFKFCCLKKGINKKIVITPSLGL